MRVVITGGSGFLGSHLSSYFLAQGHSVVCLDNLISGNMANIQLLLDNPDFQFINHDVTGYINVEGNIDYVLHFASPASPADYLKYPIQTLKVGALGTHNALGLAKVKNASFLLASTSEVYGDPLFSPQKESYWGNVNPVGPRGVYDEAKRFAEAITMAYHRQHGIDTKIARIFNTYGPHMRKNDGRVIPTFITQAINNQPLTVFGDGSQTRSFCYIADLIDGIYKLALSESNEPINLGNPDEISMNKLAKTIIQYTSSNSQIIFEPLPQDDPKIRCPDMSKANSLLAWKPQVTLRDGLVRTIDWFRGC